MNSSCFMICELNWIVSMAIVKHLLFKEKVLQVVHGNLTRHARNEMGRFSPLRANMLFVSINFSLEKDSVVFCAFVNYNIMLRIEFSS